MKILLFCHLGQIREYAEYVRAFRKVATVESRFLTMGREEYELGNDVGVFDEVKDILPGSADLDSSGMTASGVMQSLREIESRMGSVFVNRDILMDRFFQGQPRLDIDLARKPLIWTAARTRRFMLHVARRLEAELADFKPDFLFVETSFAPTRMAWRLAQEKGIPAGSFMAVRFWPERLYLETGIGYDWHEARAAYAEMQQAPMTGDELATVTARLKVIREQRVKPAYLQTDHAKGAPGFLKRLQAMRTFSGHGGWLGARARSSAVNPQVLPSKIFSPIEKYIRYRRGQKAKRFLLDNQTPFDEIRTKKYAIFFLHVQPEITVEGMAFDFQDQVSTLRNILASLPADMDLVVKEHSPMLGYRPVELYNQLAHMPGLFMAETHEDSHKLISHASVVVTLTGTTALEAVLYGKPAVVMGSIYFDGYAGIHKAENLSELKRLLSDPGKLSGATEEDSIRALGSLLRASKPGSPPRVDVTAKAVDVDSAKTMMSELKRICRAD